VSRVDLLAQVVDHDVNDVGARIEVIPPSVLGDQRAAHDAAGVAREILEHGVLLWRHLDRDAATPHLVRRLIDLEIADAEHR
jgi:hypothetical protein